MAETDVEESTTSKICDSVTTDGDQTNCSDIDHDHRARCLVKLDLKIEHLVKQLKTAMGGYKLLRQWKGKPPGSYTAEDLKVAISFSWNEVRRIRRVRLRYVNERELLLTEELAESEAPRRQLTKSGGASGRTGGRHVHFGDDIQSREAHAA